MQDGRRERPLGNDEGVWGDQEKHPLEEEPSFEEHMRRLGEGEGGEMRDEGPLSYYEESKIPRNRNGDLILDPKVRLLPRDETGVPKLLRLSVITTPEDLEYLKTVEKIELANGDEVNTELLKRCLSVDAYYDKARQNMRKANPQSYIIKVSRLFYNDDEDLKRDRADVGGGDGIVSKNDLVKGLMVLEENHELENLSEIERKRLEEFKQLASPEALVEKIRGTEYETMVDGEKCSLPVGEIFTFLRLPPAEFWEACRTDADETIGGLPKAEFAYAADKYLKENQIAKNYALPDDVEERIKRLGNGEYIDFYAVNKLTETKDTLYERAKVNPELHDAILEQMPDGASDLEKAAYVYAKMCTMLTYDEKFFAADQKGEAAEKHRELSYIEQISPENNEVVCFEFNMIYAKMLNELGLNFESDYQGLMNETYGQGHVNLKFRAGKFIVRADSVETILGGDIAKAKLGLPLTGFSCENKNQQTQQECQESFAKMYGLVQQQERERMHLGKYEFLTKDFSAMEFSDRKKMLLEKLEETDLQGVDAMAYALKMRKVLFSKEEQGHNVSVVILRNNGTKETGELEAGAVISINDADFTRKPDETDYYYLSGRGEVRALGSEELRNKLDDGTFEYVSRKASKIPGMVDRMGIMARKIYGDVR